MTLHPKDRLKNHPDHMLWETMKRRCSDPNRPDYKYYGGKGITYQESWKKFKNFISDMGPRNNKKLTLDRIDNTKGYTKENCRWVTREVQNQNRRIKNECFKGHPWTTENTIWTHNGKNKTRRCLICYKKRLDSKK